MIVIDALVPLFNAHRVAVRTAGIIKPGSFIKPCGLAYESIVIFPFADRVTPPPRLVDGLRKFTAISPDGPPLLVEQIQEDDIFGSLDDPGRPVVMKNDAGE